MARSRTAVGVICIGVVLTCSGAAQASSPTWRGVAVPRPVGAQHWGLGPTSCVPTGVCVALQGALLNSPMAARWNGSAWTLVASPPELFDAISCSAATRCEAVGALEGPNKDSAGAAQWNGHKWAVQAMPASPKGAGLLAVACRGRHYCVAVGFGSTPGAAPVAEIWNGSGWHVSKTAKPSSYRFAAAQFTGVSCWTHSGCVAVGTYRTKSAGTLAFSERLRASGWRVVHVPEPRGARKHDPVSRVLNVACPAVAWCKAVGDATNSHGHYQPLIETYSGGRWRVGSAPNPSGSSDLDGGISCVSRKSCTAVGSNNVTFTPLIEYWGGKRWTVEPTPNLPVGGVRLDAIACSKPLRCVANGFTNYQKRISVVETP